MTVRFRAAVALGLVIVFWSAVESPAQDRKQQQPKLENVKVTNGQLKGVRGGSLLVLEGTRGYVVRINPKGAKVDVTGQADASMLKSRMFIRFDAKLDKGGNATEPITKLELFTYDPQVARTGTEEKGEGAYLVAGQLISISKVGKFTLQVDPKTKIKGEIAKDAEVDVGLRGAAWLRLAKPGDTITIVGKGRAATDKVPGQVLADEIQVTIGKAEPKATPTKKKE